MQGIGIGDIAVIHMNVVSALTELAVYQERSIMNTCRCTKCYKWGITGLMTGEPFKGDVSWRSDLSCGTKEG